MAETKKRGRKWLRVLLTILGGVAAIYLLLLAANWAASLSLRAYIRGYEPVAYGEERIVPEYDETLGCYALRADGEVKIMMLSDIHIGGGCWTYKKDRKTVYEVISMLQQEKPDLVILGGDNTFAVPGPVFNGGGTLNNNMAAKDVLEIFEHEGVYFTTVFGNHDTEAFGYTDRVHLAKTYESERWRYCVFHSEFSDREASRPSVTNQLLAVRNADGSVRKLVLLMDTNDYIDGSIASSMNWRYDTIHPAQVDWARDAVLSVSRKAGLPEGETLKTLCFFHIPIGEYESAYRALAANGFQSTDGCEYVEGIWDEKVDAEMGGRIWFGGCQRTEEDPNDLDGFFETLGPDGLNALEACFCGHDHVNNAVVRYRGVLLGYNYSLDNTAYTDIARYGLQRGCTVFALSEDGSWSCQHKNAYRDYEIDPEKFYSVELETQMYPDWAP